MPPPPPVDEKRAEEQVALDMGDEYESALADATESEMVDLAGKKPACCFFIICCCCYLLRLLFVL